MPYVVVVESFEACSGAIGNQILTREGDKFIALLDESGWVEASSIKYDGLIPMNAKTFATKESAEEFARRWKGHPWWCRPNGNYKVLEVQEIAVIERRVVGYELIINEVSNEQDKLKPCPFCGNTNVHFCDDYKILCYGLDSPGVECKTCDTRNFANSKEEAIKNWNTRVELSKCSEETQPFQK